jgi:predicted membrane protein
MPHRSEWFDGPDRAVRMAHRIHRHDRPSPPRFLGFLLLVFGALIFMDALNMIDARDAIRTYWPAVFLGWGAFRLVFGGGCGRFVGGLMAAVGGVFLANAMLGWDIRFWRLIWPVLMMVFGLHILLHPRRRFRGRFGPPRDPAAVEDEDDDTDEADVEKSGRFHASAVTATIQKKVVSQSLHTGLAVAMAGGLELDLRECRMAADETTIVVRVVVGEVTLRIPRDWSVENRIAATLANVENHTDAPIDAGAKRLVLDGSAVLGNVEIRN